MPDFSCYLMRHILCNVAKSPVKDESFLGKISIFLYPALLSLRSITWIDDSTPKFTNNTFVTFDPKHNIKLLCYLMYYNFEKYLEIWKVLFSLTVICVFFAKIPLKYNFSS